VKEETVKGIITADILAVDVAGMIYRRGKAKIYNLLESQLGDDHPSESIVAFGSPYDSPKLKACKRITDDILEQISDLASRLIRDTLGDWTQEVEAGGRLSPEEEKQALKEREEDEEKFSK
jgi:hypothetical protein